MCELLVRLVDKPISGDAALDCQRTARGDVIVVMPDGHDWTPRERQAPHWVIVKVPDMSMEEGRALAAGEPSDGIRRHLRKRLFGLEPALLPRASEMLESVTLDAATLRKGKRRKPPVADPDVIGEFRHPQVIE